MNDEQQAAAKKIEMLILDASDMLADLGEEANQTDPAKAECRNLVDRIGAEYRALKESVSPVEQALLQRKLGRKVMTLRQDANWLPRKTCGSPIPMSTDKQWVPTADKLTGTEPGQEYRGPGTGPKIESYQDIVSSLAPRVGGSIEAWCGACKMLREHTISAMVNDKAKKVVCETCRAQHNFRLAPARSRKKEEGLPTSSGRIGKPRQNQMTLRKEQERTALQQELVDATDVKPFKRRGRYKAGQIIDHPEHGRGKIENVLKGSMLVRFRAGLKPVDNF